MSSSAAPLIDYLRELEGRGEKYISVDDDARKILREFYLRARNGTVASASAVSPNKAAGVKPVAAKTADVAGLSAETPHVETQQHDAAAADGLQASGSSAKEKIASLKRQVAKWPAVLALADLRKTMVFSVGNPEADIMLVGESPGYDEERLGEPFVGKAGQKLDGILKAMGVERNNTYITNILKFRPAMPNQTTNNRQPTSEELAAFMPFIQEEIKVVAPKVIIALGGTAAQALLASEESLVNMRGEFHDCDGVPLRVTYHPSYILHNEATSEKRKIWEDMLAVMDLLQMPVSEKQRGYFA